MFRDRVERYKLDEKINTKELAKRLGMNIDTVYTHLKTDNPTVETLEKYAKKLNIDFVINGDR